jgi:hypothetical protein
MILMFQKRMALQIKQKRNFDRFLDLIEIGNKSGCIFGRMVFQKLSDIELKQQQQQHLLWKKKGSVPKWAKKLRRSRRRRLQRK